MKIVVLIDKFPPLSNAGAEKIAFSLSQEYCKLGHTVVVITINEKLKRGEIKKILFQSLEIYQIGSSYNPQLISYVSLYNPWVIKSIKKILMQNSFDFAHLHNIHQHISYSVIGLLNQYKIKLILTAHDAMSIEYGKFTQGINPYDTNIKPFVNKKINPFKSFLKHKRGYNPFRNSIIKYFFKKLDKIVTVSREQEILLNINGIKNTVTIHNGIPVNESSLNGEEITNFKKKYNLSKNDRVLLWAGRLSKDKGSNQLKSVLLKLIANRNDIKLFVAGKNIFKDAELSKYIISSGWLDEKEIRLAYQIADITLVPSICYDMFPTVILESMKEGTPVISTCFGGAKESVDDGKTGYIINPFDIDVFYKKICSILDNKELNERMSKNSIDVFNNKFTIDSCMKNYMNLINNL